MKTIVLSLILGFLTLFPLHAFNGFSYQAIVKDGMGKALVQTPVQVKISILKDAGTVVYAETHHTVTSAQGYINLIIGNGSTLNGSFDTIDWKESYSIKVELDKGEGYSEISNSALRSVPYAKFAEYAEKTNADELYETLKESVDRLTFVNDSLKTVIKGMNEQLKSNEEMMNSLEGMSDDINSLLQYQDLQDKSYTNIAIPTSTLGQVHLTVNMNSVSKDTPVKAKLMYNDGNGNGFKSDIELSYQGSSSMNYPKKNFSLDLDKKIKFGNWISTDSYHLKANWIDATQARNICMGRVADDVAATLPFEQQYPWRPTWSESYRPSDSDGMFDTGAKGHVDGFPVEVFINDEYWGLYTWNLKTHRDNFCMDKSNRKHILLKAETHNNFYKFTAGDWEMKNPKIDGVTGVYDIPSDITSLINRPLAWIGSTVYDETRFKSEFENYFNKVNMMDYFIMLQAFYADDDVDKNLSMCSWDGNQWYFMWYDMDTILGLYWNGSKLLSSSGDVLQSPEPGASSKKFWNVFYKVYKTDIIERWNYLKTNALSYNNVIGRFSSFMSQISQDAYQKDFKRWTEIPSNSSCYTSLGQISSWYQARMKWLDENYFK